MSRAVNTANLGAKLQNTTGNELSGGGNIKAVTFQGSARLLTDILQLTGGNIVIPVGSTRQFTKLSSAINSVTSLIFDENENTRVVFKMDPETITETDTIDFTNTTGGRIILSGTVIPFNTITTASNASPVIGVSATTTSIFVSATIVADAAVDLPSVGDYVAFYGVSGRHAVNFPNILGTNNINFAKNSKGGVSTAIISNYEEDFDAFASLFGNIKLPYDTTKNDTLTSSLIGNYVLLTKFQAGPAITYVSPITSIQVTLENSGSTGSMNNFDYFVMNLSGGPGIIGTNQDRFSFIAQWGNPDSYTGRTFTQAGSALTFNGTGTTSQWLNVGDTILALGQKREVVSVSTSSNTAQISFPFFNGTTVGCLTASNLVISGNTPFLVKTHFERYRGVHRVAAVNSSNRHVIIEMPDYGFYTNSMAVNYTFADAYSPGPSATRVPMPIIGVINMGRETGTENPSLGLGTDLGHRGKTIKTKLFFPSGANNRTAFTISNASLGGMEGFVFETNDPLGMTAIVVGQSFKGLGETAFSNIRLGSVDAPLCFWGNWNEIVRGVGSRVVATNILASKIQTDYTSIVGIQFNSFAGLSNPYCEYTMDEASNGLIKNIVITAPSSKLLVSNNSTITRYATIKNSFQSIVNTGDSFYSATRYGYIYSRKNGYAFDFLYNVVVFDYYLSFPAENPTENTYTCSFGRNLYYLQLTMFKSNAQRTDTSLFLQNPDSFLYLSVIDCAGASIYNTVQNLLINSSTFLGLGYRGIYWYLPDLNVTARGDSGSTPANMWVFCSCAFNPNNNTGGSINFSTSTNAGFRNTFFILNYNVSGSTNVFNIIGRNAAQLQSTTSTGIVPPLIDTTTTANIYKE